MNMIRSWIVFIKKTVAAQEQATLFSYSKRMPYAVFLFIGGLSAVIWTDFVQVFIMIIGAFVLMGISKYYKTLTV